MKNGPSYMAMALVMPAMALASAGYAQDTANAGDIAEDQIAEIVVTAQQRSENLQKVPIVITAVTGAQIESAGVTSLQSLPAIAPGLNSRVTAGAFQPFIRGVGTSSNVVENPVSLYIDGVYLPQQREGLRELPDVEQVAVLKGPQGTLFGRNATGGVIQITTRRPTQDFSFMAKAGIDNYETLRGTIFVSGGLGEGVAASFSADYADQGKGYGKNLTTGNDTFQLLHSLSLRGKLAVDLGSRTEVTIIGDYMDRKERTYTFVPYPGTSFIVPYNGTPPTDKQDTRSPVEPFVAFEGGGVSLTVDHDLDFADLVSISSYRRGSSSYLFDDVPVGTPVFYVQVDKGDQPNESFTQEIRLVSKSGGAFTWAVGAYYFWYQSANDPITRTFFPPFYGPAGPAPTANRLSQTYGKETTESIAPFAQVTVALGAETNLTLGGRYTIEDRELEGRTVLTRYNGSVVTIPAPAGTKLSIKKPTWRIALDHQLTPDILGYVSYNRGIKSGGFNILNVNNPAYLPERLDAFEGGLKMQLFDRRLRLNMGGFYYDYSNLQVIQFINFAQTVVNGAKARLYGLDVDFDARLSEDFRLSGGIALLNAKFTDYRNAVGSVVRPTGGATLVVVDATGNRIPQSQKFAGTLAADYETDIGASKIRLNVTANYNGNYKIEPDNFLEQGDYVMLNSSITWTSPDEIYSVSIWGRNLADERIITNAGSQAIGYPISYGQAPRTFGVTGKVSF